MSKPPKASNWRRNKYAKANKGRNTGDGGDLNDLMSTTRRLKYQGSLELETQTPVKKNYKRSTPKTMAEQDIDISALSSPRHALKSGTRSRPGQQSMISVLSSKERKISDLDALILSSDEKKNSLKRQKRKKKNSFHELNDKSGFDLDDSADLRSMLSSEGNNSFKLRGDRNVGLKKVPTFVTEDASTKFSNKGSPDSRQNLPPPSQGSLPPPPTLFSSPKSKSKPAPRYASPKNVGLSKRTVPALPSKRGAMPQYGKMPSPQHLNNAPQLYSDGFSQQFHQSLASEATFVPPQRESETITSLFRPKPKSNRRIVQVEDILGKDIVFTKKNKKKKGFFGTLKRRVQGKKKKS